MGPSFGDKDLWIKNKSNEKINSKSFNQSCVQNTFKTDIYAYTSSWVQTLMAGSEKFKLIEIETFRVIPN